MYISISVAIPLLRSVVTVPVDLQDTAQTIIQRVATAAGGRIDGKLWRLWYIIFICVCFSLFIQSVLTKFKNLNRLTAPHNGTPLPQQQLSALSLSEDNGAALWPAGDDERVAGNIRTKLIIYFRFFFANRFNLCFS